MTTVYFIRHAESDVSVRDGKIRPLTEKGFNDCRLVTEFLQDKNIDLVLSSPYKRAIDTVKHFADKNNFIINTIEDFHERKSDSDLRRDNPDFNLFMERQWIDFNYTFSDGECLAEVQERNIAALNKVLLQHKDKNIVIGTHGTALSTIINYYDCSYGYNDFMVMVNILPWVVKMTLNETFCAGMQKTDLFKPEQKADYNQCKVYTYDTGTLKAYRFVVIFTRYRGKWLYCRAKERGTFETAGGHIEHGETPLDAAKRELYEETGAKRFDIISVFDYSVHIPAEFSNGQVFLANIHELGALPDYEMAEIKLFDGIPEKMRFPQILPVLFKELNKIDKSLRFL